MNILKKGQMLIMVLLVCYSSLEAAEQPTPEKRALRFTVSEEATKWYGSWSRRVLDDNERIPTYAAVFRLRHVRYWRRRDLINVTVARTIEGWAGINGRRVQGLFEHWVLQEGPTSEARHFYLLLPDGAPVEPLEDIDEEELDAIGRDWREIDELERISQYEARLGEGIRTQAPEDGTTEWGVYANSEEEARVQAETVIALISKLAYAPIEEAKLRLQQERDIIAEVESKIPQIEKEKKDTEAKLAEYKRTVHYRNKDEAQRSILEWIDLLNVIEVDLVGIKARLATIKKLKQDIRGTGQTDTVRDSLTTMRFGAEVELASALARKDAAQSFGKKAADFVALSESVEDLAWKLSVSRDQMEHSRKKEPVIQKRLARLLSADMPPVEVFDNEVKIHPVEVLEPEPKRRKGRLKR
ncbi:MAG: hypothetical protein ACYTEL_20735 [Planctomycetota bacterium]